MRSQRQQLALATKWPLTVTRYTTVFSLFGTKSPGVAEVSAFARVVTTADAHATPCPSFNFTARSTVARQPLDG